MSAGVMWPQQGIVAGYHMDDVNDFSGNGKTLTNNGTISFGGPGKFGNCAILGSANSTKYLSRADGMGIDLSGACGFSGWFFLQANPASSKQCRMVDWRSTTGTGRWLTLDYYNNSGTYQLTWYPNTASPISFDYVLSLDTWHLADLDLNVDGYAYLYIDGCCVRVDARGTHLNAVNKTVIGAETAGTAGFYWFGNADEVAFFNCNRSAQRIRRWYAYSKGRLI